MRKLSLSLALLFGFTLTNPILAMKFEDTTDTVIPKTWKLLKPEDRIAIIAPAAVPSKEQLAKAEKLIADWGYEAHSPTVSLYDEYYANTHKKRKEQFVESLKGSAEALWAVRGGFGSMHVVSLLRREEDFSPPAKPKCIVGFSDITYLHLQAAAWEWPSLYAPVLGLGKEVESAPSVNKEASLTAVMECLSGKTTELNHSFKVLRKGSAEGPLRGSVIGGNLACVQRSQKTSAAIDTKGKFFFFEDTAEAPNRLDSLLTSLVDGGVFDEVKGVIVGDMPVTGRRTEEFMTRFFINLKEDYDLDFPVLYSPRFGHGLHNDVMPLGTKAILTLGEEEAILNVKVNESAYSMD